MLSSVEKNRFLANLRTRYTAFFRLTVLAVGLVGVGGGFPSALAETTVDKTLFVAIQNSDWPAVDKQLKRGAYINASVYTKSPIVFADFGKPNPIARRVPPIAIAVEQNNVALLNKLEQMGAHLNASVYLFDDKNLNLDSSRMSLLQYALQLKADKVVTALHSRGADFKADDFPYLVAAGPDYRPVVNKMIEDGVNLDVTTNGSHRSALMMAVVLQDDGLVKQLIDAGADVSLSDIAGDSATNIALKNTALSAMELLLNAGADLTLSQEPAHYDYYGRAYYHNSNSQHISDAELLKLFYQEVLRSQQYGLIELLKKALGEQYNEEEFVGTANSYFLANQTTAIGLWLIKFIENSNLTEDKKDEYLTDLFAKAVALKDTELQSMLIRMGLDPFVSVLDDSLEFTSPFIVALKNQDYELLRVFLEAPLSDAAQSAVAMAMGEVTPVGRASNQYNLYTGPAKRNYKNAYIKTMLTAKPDLVLPKKGWACYVVADVKYGNGNLDLLREAHNGLLPDNVNPWSCGEVATEDLLKAVITLDNRMVALWLLAAADEKVLQQSYDARYGEIAYSADVAEKLKAYGYTNNLTWATLAIALQKTDVLNVIESDYPHLVTDVKRLEVALHFNQQQEIDRLLAKLLLLASSHVSSQTSSQVSSQSTATSGATSANTSNVFAVKNIDPYLHKQLSKHIVENDDVTLLKKLEKVLFKLPNNMAFTSSADAKITCRYCTVPTIFAVVQAGAENILAHLVAAGADVAQLYDDKSLYVYANQASIITFLAKNGLDINAKSQVRDGLYNALSEAIINKNVQKVQWLLAAGADPDQMAYNTGYYNMHLFSLNLAAQYETIEVMHALLKAGANPNATLAKPRYQRCIGARPYVKSVLMQMVEAQIYNPAAIDVLIAAGADPLYKNDCGHSIGSMLDSLRSKLNGSSGHYYTDRAHISKIVEVFERHIAAAEKALKEQSIKEQSAKEKAVKKQSLSTSNED